MAAALKKNRVSLDWMLVAVAMIAGALVAGTMIRTGGTPEGDGSASVGGLHALDDPERVVAFEDFSFGAAGWTPATVDDTEPGFGAILGRFSAATVERVFPLPEGTTEAIVAFDLVAIDDWALETLNIEVNGHQAASLSLSTRPEVAGNQGRLILPSDRVSASVQPRFAPTHRGYGDGTPAMQDQTFRVALTVARPGDAITLILTDTLAGDVGTASWALDNLSVIATLPTAD